ncbi:Fe-S cluster assembly protein SufB, partial [Streptococcus alactolyticus]|nr:Fe-S cluster assembly protein SufB [Streptococcus alactolyticus]
MNKQNQYINEAAMQVENRYDFRNEEKDSYRINKGLTPEIIEEISAKKDEPQWMRDFRLRCLETYHDLDVPPWG